jgi:hypothetical protein
MRRFHIPLFMSAVLATAGTLVEATTPAAATVEDLGRGVLAAIRSGSFETMTHLLPTAEDMSDALEAEAQGMAPDQTQEFRSRIPNIVAAMRKELGEQFARLREQSGINWSSAVMKGVRIKVHDPATGQGREIDAATLAAERRPGAAVQILLEAGGQPLEIDLQDCFKSSRGWLVMEALRLRRP